MTDGLPTAARFDCRNRKNSGAVDWVKLLKRKNAPFGKLHTLRFPSPSWWAGITTTPLRSGRRQFVAVRNASVRIEVLDWNHFPNRLRIQPLSGCSKDKVKRHFPNRPVQNSFSVCRSRCTLRTITDGAHPHNRTVAGGQSTNSRNARAARCFRVRRPG